MKFLIFIVFALSPLCAIAQGVVYVPAPSYPGQYPPFNQHGVVIGPYAPDVQNYDIDLNGDGIVDYMLSVTHAQDASISSVLQFNIVPTGSNSVLATVDEYGAAMAVNLGAGEVVGSQSSWANAGNNYPPILNYFINLNIIGQDQFTFGNFVNDTGFVGLQFWADNQEYYGFLQIDTRFSPLYGGLYQGYGWNTTPGESITTSYFRDTIQVPDVPEPGGWALLVAGSVFLCRWKKSFA